MGPVLESDEGTWLASDKGKTHVMENVILGGRLALPHPVGCPPHSAVCLAQEASWHMLGNRLSYREP